MNRQFWIVNKQNNTRKEKSVLQEAADETMNN